MFILLPVGLRRPVPAFHFIGQEVDANDEIVANDPGVGGNLPGDDYAEDVDAGKLHETQSGE